LLLDIFVSSRDIPSIIVLPENSIVSDSHKLSLKINHINLSELKWIPTWNNIIIEQNLRKFIMLTINIQDLKNFLNLNRNAKYRQLNVN
jgi:hypothetical protein